MTTPVDPVIFTNGDQTRTWDKANPNHKRQIERFRKMGWHESSVAAPQDCPTITICIVSDAEKDAILLDHNLYALRKLNSLHGVQVLVIDQCNGRAEIEAICQKYGITRLDAGNEMVGDTPLWDVADSLARHRDKFEGDYLTVWHKEFIASPGSIQAIREGLHARPELAAGNLRRLGVRKTMGRFYQQSSNEAYSDVLRAALRTEHDELISAVMKSVPNISWPAVMTDASLIQKTEWNEDVFFARMDWVDEHKLLTAADRLLFQDIFDLLGFLWRELARRKQAGRWVRLPIETTKLYHLWHAKGYLHFTEAVIEYLASNSEKWAGTRYADSDELRRLAEFGKCRDGFKRNPIIEFRRGEAGSEWRFERAIEAMLDVGLGVGNESQV